MAYQSEWSIGATTNTNSDPWASQRGAYDAAGGYAGTGMDIPNGHNTKTR